jgi:hypothetical protein
MARDAKILKRSVFILEEEVTLLRRLIATCDNQREQKQLNAEYKKLVKDLNKWYRDYKDLTNGGELND